MLFSRKTPEEKEAARLEKLRRTEGNRVFGGALMTPVGELNLADICLVKLSPETQTLRLECQKRSYSIPYAALCGMCNSSEDQIARDESPISALEMDALLRGGAEQFVGELKKTASSRSRWFTAIDYADAVMGENRRLVLMAFNMRGPYFAGSPLYATVQFEETVADILRRRRALDAPEEDL